MCKLIGEEVMTRNENMEKRLTARAKILEVLRDGQWHYTKDLKVYTKVSPRTLYKNLNELGAYIERKEDKTTYPNRVYYRASPTLLALMIKSKEIEAAMKTIMTKLSNTEDLVTALEFINVLNNSNILAVLEIIKKSNLKFSDIKQISFLMRSFVLTPFEHFMAGLVKATSKIIDEIDFEQFRKDIKKE